MLSRLSLRNVQAVSAAIRGTVHTSAAGNSTNSTNSTGMIQSYVPENYEPPVWRPTRLVDPLPVRFGFIPDNWFTFFYPKTGVTGPYVFMGSLATYLLSKEIYVLEHEFYNSLSLILILIVGIKKFGPLLKAYLDRERETEARLIDQPRQDALDDLAQMMEDIKVHMFQLEGHKMVMDVKLESIFVQLETAYRERMAQVHKAVKERLDYHVQADTIQRTLEQKHMSTWIINNVMKSITPDLEKAALQQCITDLKALSAKA